MDLERLVTSINNEDTIAHLHRYALAINFVKGKDVLDIACGEGYGSFLMSKICKSVVGMDIDNKVIENAEKKYKHTGLSFKNGSATHIPLDSSSIDVVVSFETIEHLVEQDEMMAEIKRVLKPNGILIISSPDKKNYSDVRNFNNKYHLKELYYNEFITLINTYFKCKKEYFQKYVYGSVIISKDNKSTINEYNGNYNEIKHSDVFSNMLYNIVIASDMLIEDSISDSFFDGYKIYEDTILEIYNSKTYKAGVIISFPLRILRKIFK